MSRRGGQRKGSEPGSGNAGRSRGSGAAEGGGLLSFDDLALWEHTARSIGPAKGLKPRVHTGAEGHREELRAGRQALHATTRIVPPSGPAPGSRPGPPYPEPRHQEPPPIVEFDRRKARRLASGRQEIDARIDLHGMRQREAHAALRSFLHACHARGLSTVLVITGKGTRASVDPSDGAFDLFGEHERGALKRNVPHWLAEPDMRAIVVSHRPAAIRHGGEGALYVQLRRVRQGAP